MAVLQKVALYPQQRLELQDARAQEAYVQNDFAKLMSGFLSDQSYVLQGFEISNYSSAFSLAGLQIKISSAVLFHSQATTQANGFYVAAGTEPDQTITLPASSTCYVEADLSVTTGAPDQRTFIDPTTGEEFSDQVDTAIFLNVDVSANTTGFTAGRMPLYRVITDGNGVATSITDSRNLFFSLVSGGASPSLSNEYPWPALPNSTYARQNTPLTSTGPSDPQPWEGGDKNIATWKEWMDAVMTKLKELGGTASWTAQASGNIFALLQMISATVAPISVGALWSWSGTNLSISDASLSPSGSDVIASLRVFGTSQTFSLLRADGQASTSSIPIADGSVLFVDIPASGNRSYSGNGSGATNYQVVARASFTPSDKRYVIAYREGTKLHVGGQLYLNSGESVQIGRVPGAVAKSYPNVFLSPLGFGDATTLAGAIALLPASGGVICLMDDITISAPVTIPANTKILGRNKNATMTFTGTGSLSFTGAGSILQDVALVTAANLTMVDANGGTNLTVQNCTFTAPPAGTATCVRLRANGCVIVNNIFNGVLSPSTSDAILADIGFAGSIIRDNFYRV